MSGVRRVGRRPREDAQLHLIALAHLAIPFGLSDCVFLLTTGRQESFQPEDLRMSRVYWGGGEESAYRTWLGRRFKYFDSCPLSNWHPGSDHSFIPPSLAPESQKSGSPTTGFRDRERSFGMGRTAGPCAPADWLLPDPEPRRRTGLHATTRGLTVRVSFQGSLFQSSLSTSHVACHMSHHRQAAHAPHQRFTMGFICGSVTLTCRWPRSSFPILLTLLHLWFHLALFCSACPDFRFHQEPPYLLSRPRRMADCFLNWPLCPLPVSNSSLGRTPTMAPG